MLTRKIDKHNSIDARGFDKMLTELRRFTGADFAEIIRFEAARILEESIKRTDPKYGDSTRRIKARYTYTNDNKPNKKLIGRVQLNGRRRIVRNIRKKGAMLLRGRGKNRKKIFVATATNPDWKPLQAELKRLRDKILKTRGMSKATWLHIAKKLKLKKVKRSKYIDLAYGRMSSNMKASTATRQGGKVKYEMVLKNFSKVAMIRGGARKGADARYAFYVSFHGRVNYFKTNLSKGVFKKSARTMKKYPGITVTPLRAPKSSDRV